jgi:hypothetical protein
MPDYPTQLDLRRARRAIVAAELAERPSDRYLAAHLAALQIAAVILAWRADPTLGPRGSRPRNVWRMLADVAPEFAEWAAFFAATQAKREAVRAGATTIVSAREADDLLRDAQCFLAMVERSRAASA